MNKFVAEMFQELRDLEAKVAAGEIEVLLMEEECEVVWDDAGRPMKNGRFQIVLKCRHLPEVEDE